MTDRQRLLEAHRAAASFYREALTAASRAGTGPRAYLASRGLEGAFEEHIWEIGYAPAGWTLLLTYLEASGFTDGEIHAAGLAVETRRGSLIDRFRDRLMLGIHDANLDLIGFIGRCPPAVSEIRGAAPKYLNSPATELYTKGHQLYGLAERLDALHDGATPVLVEGPLDVLAIAGLASREAVGIAAVSTCGTTLRPEQADLLRTHSQGEVIVAYDGDAAGRKGATTAYERLRGRFNRVWAAPLPAGEDPASVAAADPGRLLESLQTQRPLADQLIDDVMGPCRLDNAEARVAALHQSTRLIAGFAPADVGRQVARVAEYLGFPTHVVTDDLSTAASHIPSTAPKRNGVIHRSSRTAGVSSGLAG